MSLRRPSPLCTPLRAARFVLRHGTPLPSGFDPMRGAIAVSAPLYQPGDCATVPAARGEPGSRLAPLSRWVRDGIRAAHRWAGDITVRPWRRQFDAPDGTVDVESPFEADQSRRFSLRKPLYGATIDRTGSSITFVLTLALQGRQQRSIRRFPSLPVPGEASLQRRLPRSHRVPRPRNAAWPAPGR